MDDFKPGDQAQCIFNEDNNGNPIPGLQLFNIYTVKNLRECSWLCRDCLEIHTQIQMRLKEVSAPIGYWGFLPHWFRKPPPLPADEITREADVPLRTIKPRRIRELEPSS